MDVQEYISSGILESYVLGSCSPEESRNVEQMMSEHSEIRDEIRTIQETLELAAMQHAIAPPVGLRARIWESLEEEAAPVVPMHRDSEEQSYDRSAGRTWLAYAASFALIFSAGSVAFFFYSENKKTRQQLATIEQNNREMQQKVGRIQSDMKVLTHSATKKVTLEGVETSKDSKAVVFWNQNMKKVMLTGVKLPEAPSDKQYQLWALVDGVPVDAGIFDYNDAASGMVEMKAIDKSQAFAITLEPKGGSPSPHLEALCVIGNVAG